MNTSIIRSSGLVAMAALMTIASIDQADGQTTVTTTTTVGASPAVVGYAAERRGLFGLRTSYRPIVANVPVQKTVTVRQQTPVYVAPVAVQRPVVAPPTPLPTPVVVQRPVVVPPPTVVVPTTRVVPLTPVVPVVPVQASYLAPAPPVAVPVTTYYAPYYRY